MTRIPIYTSEPMVTRALAAEMRHDPKRFVELLHQRTGLSGIRGIPQMRCEGVELIDIELTFATSGEPLIVGIEAKFDHALTREQIDRQLSRLAHVVVLLPDEGDTPQWVLEHDRLSSMTWTEALACFSESRLSAEDVGSIPLQKRRIERRLERLPLVLAPPQGWFVQVARNGAGLPAILMTSPRLPDGSELRAQLQVVGRSMPQDLEGVRFEYFLGVAIEDEETAFPDPEKVEAAPAWIVSLRNLRDKVLVNDLDSLLIDTSRPGAGRSLYGKRKLQLITKHAPDSTWIAKGYRDWALGVKSRKVSVDRLEDLASLLEELATRWFEAESQRQMNASRGGF